MFRSCTVCKGVPLAPNGISLGALQNVLLSILCAKIIKLSEIYVGDSVRDLDTNACGPGRRAFAQSCSPFCLNLVDDFTKAGSEPIISFDRLSSKRWTRSCDACGARVETGFVVVCLGPERAPELKTEGCG